MHEGAELLVVCFEHAWDTKEEALEDMEKFVQEDRIALVAVEPSYQSKGIGTKLVAILEEEVYKQGGIIIYLGTDDEDGRTSLSEGDLFEDTYEKIKNIRNLDRHPYAFYEKQGYKIVGVFPDANGFGKPDIWMAKRIKDK
ncbi:GNAT family N-acetyltransferase [Zhenhengia yiwuensis]